MFVSNFVNAEKSRDEYKRMKNRILDLVRNTQEFYQDKNSIDEAKTFETLHQNLLDGEFSIVLIGEFSSGKSTLLNALMKERILPSFTNETTATVNFLRHSDRTKKYEKGCVYYYDGTNQSLENVNLETVLKYVSTKGEDVASKVKHLDLYIDSDFLKDGVTLVDSPGLNGIAEGHREITEQQILKSHASIFVFSSDHPGSKTDFEMLHELKKKVKTIIFVLNKIDAIKSEENETSESVIESLKKNYKKQFPEEITIPEIWPIAAYPALVARSSENMVYHEKSNFTVEEKKLLEEKSKLFDFENRLISFLTKGEKAQAQMKAPVAKVISLIHETSEGLIEQINLLQTAQDSEEVQKQINELNHAINELENQINETRNTITNNISQDFKEVQEELSAKITRLKDKKLLEIESFDDFNELNDYFAKFETDYLRRAESIIEDIQEVMRENFLNLVSVEYSNQAAVFEEKLSSINNGVSVKLKNHIDPSARTFEVGLEAMQEKVAKLNYKLQELKDKAENLENDYESKLERFNKSEQLKQKIEGLESKKETLNEIYLPPTKTNFEDVKKKEWRGGLLGTCWDILVSRKGEIVKVPKVDDSELQAVIKHRDKRIQECNQKIDDLNILIPNVDGESVRSIEKKKARAEAELEMVRNQITEEIAKDNDMMKSKYSKEIKKIKRDLRNFCDDASFEVNKELGKTLRDKKKEYVDIILEVIEANLRKAMSIKGEEMKDLKNKLDSSTSEKNQNIAELQSYLDRSRFLLDEALKISTELDSIQVDEIKQMTI